MKRGRSRVRWRASSASHYQLTGVQAGNRSAERGAQEIGAEITKQKGSKKFTELAERSATWFTSSRTAEPPPSATS